MNFPTIALALTFFLVTPGRVLSQEGAPLTPENEIRQLEKDFADAIQTQDSTLVKKFVADDYFLAIGIRGVPLQIVPRNKWILAIKDYVTKSFTIDDIRVHLYGDLAVAILLYSQKAVLRGQERSAQFVLTDIWKKGENGWQITERHSSRPEVPTIVRPK